MAEYTFSDFNISEARLGCTLGYKDSDGNVHVATLVKWVGSMNDEYCGLVMFGGDTAYNFLPDGSCYDSSGNFRFRLSIVKAAIHKTTGTRITRIASTLPVADTDTSQDGSQETVFSIATLQPREEIAMRCLQAMIPMYANPLNTDNARIVQLVAKSFLFAQEFINQAVLYREKEATSSSAKSDTYAAVDAASLSSDTDKLLYNIATALGKLNLSATFPDTVNAVIAGNVNAEVNGSVKAEVSGKVNAEVSGSVETVAVDSGTV